MPVICSLISGELTASGEIEIVTHCSSFNRLIQFVIRIRVFLFFGCR